jgi:hypothetical protein
MTKDFASAEVQELLKHFGFTGELENDEGEPEGYASIPQRGIEFLFKDEAYLKKLKRRNIGDGPFLLTSIFFFSGDDPDYQPFKGQLPRGLRWPMSRKQAWEALGKPDWESPDGTGDSWYMPTWHLIVMYPADGKTITDCSVQLPQT